MGVDFLRKVAKPYKRGWDRGLRQLCLPDLFAQENPTVRRTFVARGVGAEAAVAGMECELRARAPDRIDVYRNCAAVAIAERAPSDLVSAIAARGGVALGRVTNVHTLSGALDFEVD